MATYGNDDNPLYNFYSRYLWGPADFGAIQDSIINRFGGLFHYMFDDGLLSGGAITPNGSNASVNVAAYIAIGHGGYLHVKDSSTVVPIAAGNVSNPRIDLIVAEPDLVDGLTIARPTLPHDTVALTTLQKSKLTVVQGTPAATPTVPATVAGQVVIGSVRVPAGWTSTVSSGDINQTYDTERIRPATMANVVGYSDAADGSYGITGYGHGRYNAGGVYGKGAGTGVGVKAERGSGTGTGSTDDALESVQNIFLSGTSPDATTAFTNRITKANIVKAWGYVEGTNTNPTLRAGFNVGALTYQNVGAQIRVELASNFANQYFAPFAMRIGAGTAYPANINTGPPSRFEILDSAGSISNSGWHYIFVVLGLQ